MFVLVKIEEFRRAEHNSIEIRGVFDTLELAEAEKDRLELEAEKAYDRANEYHIHEFKLNESAQLVLGFY